LAMEPSSFLCNALEEDSFCTGEDETLCVLRDGASAYPWFPMAFETGQSSRMQNRAQY
jgi:hypothetical protein